MELVLIPILLIGGAVLVYLGVHGSQATAWAAYGPHVANRSGRRVSFAPSTQTPEPEAHGEPEMVPYTGPGAYAQPVPYVEPSLFAKTERPELRAVDAVPAAPSFTHSDALIGELMTELALVREELSHLRDRMDVLTRSIQPV